MFLRRVVSRIKWLPYNTKITSIRQIVNVFFPASAATFTRKTQKALDKPGIQSYYNVIDVI